MIDIADEVYEDENDGRRPAKITAADIRTGYSTRKARNDLITQTWVYYVLRPLSFHLTPFFVNMGLSANAVTVLGLIPLLAGAACMVLGARSDVYFVAGAFLVNLWFLMDVIDGNIARYEKKANRFGELFDWLIGLVAAVIVPVSICLGLYGTGTNRQVFDFGLGIEGWVWLVMGTVLVTSDFCRNTASLRARQVMRLESVASTERRVTARDIIPRAFASFQKPLMLIAAFAGWMGVFLTVSALYSVSIMIGMMAAVFCRARQMDKDDQGVRDGNEYR